MLIAAEILVATLIVAGGFFALVGAIGLFRLPDMMMRLHGPTKATTLGVGGILIASMIYFWVFEDALSIHELMISLFLFITAPLTANLIAKAHLHRHPEVARELPAPDTRAQACNWSTFDEKTPDLDVRG